MALTTVRLMSLYILLLFLTTRCRPGPGKETRIRNQLPSPHFNSPTTRTHHLGAARRDAFARCPISVLVYEQSLLTGRFEQPCARARRCGKAFASESIHSQPGWVMIPVRTRRRK